MKFVNRSFVAKIIGILAVLALAIVPLVKKTPVTKAGAIGSISVSAADNTPSASTTYTITFTPATAAASYGSVNINFQAPPDARFGIGNATLGSGSSAIFESIQYRNTDYGTVSVNVSSLAATEYTLIFENMTNPSKAGKYTVEVDTYQGFSNLDRGSKSVTIGTVAVEGTVTIPGGNGANGAYVEAQEKGNFGIRFGSPTASDGTYGIGGLTSGKTYILNVYLNSDPNDSYSNTKGLAAPDSQEITYSGTPITANFQLKAASKTITGTLTYSGGAAVSGGNISAMRTDGPGFMNTQTNSAGAYSLSLSGGSWEIRPDTYAGPGREAPDYAFSGPGTRVQFAKDDAAESKTGVNFTVIRASATITGSVTPSPGGFAGVGVHNKGGFGTGTGLDPNTNSFTLRVPPGTYELELFMDPMQAGEKYLMPGRDPITVSDNETKNLGVITLLKMDKRINAAVKDNATGTGLADFQIGCFKPRGSGFSMGQTDSSGNASVPVIAGEWGCMAMSGMSKGGPGGGEGPGPQAEQQQEKKYVVMGGPQFVTVGDNPPTINFKALEANRTINVVTVDGSGNTLSVQGFIEARLVGSDLGNEFDKGGGLGQPIDPMMPGMAQLKVPAGIYDLYMMTPPGSDYSPGDSTRVDVSSGDASATLVLLPNDSTIQGTLYDEDHNIVTNVFAMISAVNPKGAFIPGDVDPSTGTYSMRVPSAGGTLRMGYFVDPESGYFPQSSTGTVTPISGGTQVFDITMKKATATLNVTVKNPSGSPISGAFVKADNKKTDRDMKMDFFFHMGEQTDSNGQISLLLPDGAFTVEAFLAPETLRDNKWMPPKASSVTLAKNDNQSITLSFQAADIEIKGKVTKSSDGSAVSDAIVTAFSENNEAIYVETDSSGNYTVNVTSGAWLFKAENDDGTDPYLSDSAGLDTSGAKSFTQNLAMDKDTAMSAMQTRSFDTDNSTSITLTGGSLDGAKIEAPQDSLDLDGDGNNATITASSTVEMPLQKGNIPLGAGLDITASNNQGQSITSTNSSVSITIPVEKSELSRYGYDITDVGKEFTLSYYDDQNGTWVPVEGSVSAIESGDKVMVTGSVAHFTTFAVTAAADTTPPAAPTSITAASGAAKITLNWTNPTDSDLAGIKIYRSTTSGTVGDLLTTISNKTTTSYDNTGLTSGTTYYYVVRSYDTSGNISINTSQVSAAPGAALPATGADATLSSWWALMLLTPLLGVLKKRSE